MGRILALDIGQKRTGIAVTDPLKIIANGLTTIPSHTVLSFLADYFSRESVELLVVCSPKQMDNSSSEAMKFIDPIVRAIRKAFPGMPIQFVDERFTSTMAKQAMIDGDMKKMDRRNKAMVDTISATIILQSYLESLSFNR